MPKKTELDKAIAKGTRILQARAKERKRLALAQVEPDALKRLEKWMLKGFAWQAILGLGINREPGVRLRKGLDDPYPLAMGKTLSAAIHSALDQAGAKR